jgi:two-component system, chemotaxis family, CheB/CheR fusion protein
LLVKDLSINVTHFFRDPAAFALLGGQIIPDIVRQQTFDRPLRIWVPGCSTGEEAYSITMLFLEQIGTAKRNIKPQVFASDIDADCVAFARNGIYPESIEADVAPRRLARFFTKEDHSYQVVRELRETVVFTGQSLLANAPFSGLALVSCRDLFIYLNAEAQRKILSRFHLALRQGGVLFLGSSESVGSASDRFEKYRVYRRVSRSGPGEVEFPRARIDPLRSPVGLLPQQPVQRRYGFGELSRRALLEAYAPASVLINAKHEGLYDRYLRIASGGDTQDVLAMAREGLRAKLRSAIRRAEGGPARITVTGAHIKREGRLLPVNMTALPVEGDKEELFLISFVDDPTPELGAVRSVETAADASRVVQIGQELEATREELQSAIR